MNQKRTRKFVSRIQRYQRRGTVALLLSVTDGCGSSPTADKHAALHALAAYKAPFTLREDSHASISAEFFTQHTATVRNTPQQHARLRRSYEVLRSVATSYGALCIRTTPHSNQCERAVSPSSSRLSHAFLTMVHETPEMHEGIFYGCSAVSRTRGQL